MLSSTASQIEQRKEKIIETSKNTINKVYMKLSAHKKLAQWREDLILPDVVCSKRRKQTLT